MNHDNKVMVGDVWECNNSIRHILFVGEVFGFAFVTSLMNDNTEALVILSLLLDSGTLIHREETCEKCIKGFGIEDGYDGWELEVVKVSDKTHTWYDCTFCPDCGRKL